MIPLKTHEEIAAMRTGGAILAGVLARLAEDVLPGVTTAALAQTAEKLFADAGVRSAFKGYKGYPGSICVSVNEQVVHGIPGDRRIADGDIVSIDAGIAYRGFYLDAAVTAGAGTLSAQARQLIEATRESLQRGIEAFRPGNRLGDIAAAVQQWVEARGFSVVRQFVGHGIGRQLHEDPEIPNFGKAGTGALLRSGMVFAIEPMVNAGGWECRILQDGWTAVTCDGGPSAHFEHTVALTEDGPEILTCLKKS